MFWFEMPYFFLIPVGVLVLWMFCIICIRSWLSHRAYKFIMKEVGVKSILNSDDEVFFTQNNSASLLSLLLLKFIALISRN
jgi:hypothetical protein